MPRPGTEPQRNLLPAGAWCPISKVCAHLGLGRCAIMAAIRRGEVKAARLGRRIIINVESLMRQLEAAAVATAKALASDTTNNGDDLQ